MCVCVCVDVVCYYMLFGGKWVLFILTAVLPAQSLQPDETVHDYQEIKMPFTFTCSFISSVSLVFAFPSQVSNVPV